MASLTASYLLFLEAAKEYGWPIEDEKFFRAVTVGFFAPDILRFALGDKQAGNIESKGRRITHFCGGKMIYPKIEELKDTIINHKERFYAEAFPGFENFKLVDPKIEIPVFMENNKYLFDESIDNQAYAMGLYAALEIDKEFDYIFDKKTLCDIVWYICDELDADYKFHYLPKFDHGTQIRVDFIRDSVNVGHILFNPMIKDTYPLTLEIEDMLEK